MISCRTDGVDAENIALDVAVLAITSSERIPTVVLDNTDARISTRTIRPILVDQPKKVA